MRDGSKTTRSVHQRSVAICRSPPHDRLVFTALPLVDDSTFPRLVALDDPTARSGRVLRAPLSRSVQGANAREISLPG